MTKSAPVLTIQPAKLFTPSAILVTSLYGLVLMLPVVVAVLAVTLLHFGWWTFLLPLATIAAATYLLPIGFGNPYISRLVLPLRPASMPAENLFVVQCSTSPRIRSGPMALLEDADDVGILVFTDQTVEFYGDSLRLTVPFREIIELGRQNAGPRALFAYGQQLVFKVPTLNGTLFRFAERSSKVLPSSRRIADRMYRKLEERIQQARVMAGAKNA